LQKKLARALSNLQSFQMVTGDMGQEGREAKPIKKQQKEGGEEQKKDWKEKISSTVSVTGGQKLH